MHVATACTGRARLRACATHRGELADVRFERDWWRRVPRHLGSTCAPRRRPSSSRLVHGPQLQAADARRHACIRQSGGLTHTRSEPDGQCGLPPHLSLTAAPRGRLRSSRLACMWPLHARDARACEHVRPIVVSTLAASETYSTRLPKNSHRSDTLAPCCAVRGQRLASADCLLQSTDWLVWLAWRR